MPKKYTVDKDFHNTRFDKWFRSVVISLPQSLIEKILRKNKVKVNRKKIKTSYRVQTGDIVEVYEALKLKKIEKPRLNKYSPSKKEKKQYDSFIIEDNENLKSVQEKFHLMDS